SASAARENSRSRPRGPRRVVLLIAGVSWRKRRARSRRTNGAPDRGIVPARAGGNNGSIAKASRKALLAPPALATGVLGRSGAARAVDVTGAGRRVDVTPRGTLR